LLKEALLEKGREKMSEMGKAGRDSQLGGLSVTVKPPEPKEPPAHNTRKTMAESLGWSEGKVSQAELVRREAPQVWKEVKAGATFPWGHVRGADCEYEAWRGQEEQAGSRGQLAP
jgi:hypothetical protein